MAEACRNCISERHLHSSRSYTVEEVCFAWRYHGEGYLSRGFKQYFAIRLGLKMRIPPDFLRKSRESGDFCFQRGILALPSEIAVAIAEKCAIEKLLKPRCVLLCWHEEQRKKGGLFG